MSKLHDLYLKNLLTCGAGGTARGDLVAPGQASRGAAGGEGGPCLLRDDVQGGGRRAKSLRRTSTIKKSIKVG